MDTVPDEVRVFVKERRPANSEAAGKLADDFIQARKESQNVRHHDDKSGIQGRNSRRQCNLCGKAGHIAKDCRSKAKSQEEEKGQEPVKLGSEENGQQSVKSGSGKPKRDLKDIECFNCREKGHYSANCPKNTTTNAMLCTQGRVVGNQVANLKRQRFTAGVGNMKTGTVEGKSVSDILLDTGCSQTLVHQELVPEYKLKEGEAVAICCAHGDTVLYPLAEVTMEIEGKPIEIEAAVSDTLPMSVLLGTDNPELSELLTGMCRRSMH